MIQKCKEMGWKGALFKCESYKMCYLNFGYQLMNITGDREKKL